MLTAHEKERNRRIGDILLFFKNSAATKDGALVKALLSNSASNLHAAFSNKDAISGKVIVPSREQIRGAHLPIIYGKGFEKSCGQLELKLAKCECFVVLYNHAEYLLHSTNLLPNVTMPNREVEDFAIYHIQRRVFRGEEAI
jgi:hypothetical protein